MPRKKKVNETVADAGVSVSDVPVSVADAVFMHIPVESVIAVPGANIRNFCDKDLMKDLVENVRINGIVEPLIVNHRPEGSYELISGSRRLNAAITVQLETVPCIVHENISDLAVHRIMISENLLREELDPIAEAMGMQRLMDDGVKQEEIGKEVGKSQEFIANRVRLLKLHPDIQTKIISREINPTDGLSILGEISKIRAASSLVDNDAFIESVSVTFAKGKNYHTGYDFGIVFRERVEQVYMKDVVIDPCAKLSYSKESQECSGCKKCYRYVCFDPSCFKKLDAQRVARAKSGPEKKVKKERTPEEILNEENLSLFYSELREKVAMLSADRKLELVALMAFRRESDQVIERSMKIVYGVKKFDKDSLTKQFEQIDALFVDFVLHSCCNVFSMKDIRISDHGIAYLCHDLGITFSDAFLKASGASATLDKILGVSNPAGVSLVDSDHPEDEKDEDLEDENEEVDE